MDGKYDKITFDLGCEQDFGYDVAEKFGQYKITIKADDAEVWSTNGRLDYEDVLTNVLVPLGDNCARLEIKLEQYKGTNGTLNVVMGDFKLYFVEEDDDEE